MSLFWFGDDGLCDDSPPVTPESVSRAKAARDEERARITEQTGLRIEEDGHLVVDPDGERKEPV